MMTSSSCALEVEGVGLLIYRCTQQGCLVAQEVVGEMIYEARNGPANTVDLEEVKRVSPPMSGVGSLIILIPSLCSKAK